MDPVFTIQSATASDQVKALVRQWSLSYPQAIAQGLNDQAFAFRAAGPKVLASRLVIRNYGFVKSRFLVQKVSTLNVLKMAAIAGSIKSQRFSGWDEFYGSHTPEHRSARTFGLNARGGDKTKQAKQQYRIKPDMGMMLKYSDFSSLPTQARIWAMLRTLFMHMGRNALFVLPQVGKFSPGLYRIKHVNSNAKTKARYPVSKITRVQSYQTSAIPKQKWDWAAVANANVINESLKIFVRALQAYVKEVR